MSNVGLVYQIPARVLSEIQVGETSVRHVVAEKVTTMIFDWKPNLRSSMTRLVYLFFRSPTGEGERLLCRSRYMHSFTMSRNRELSPNMRFSHQDAGKVEYDLTEDYEKLIREVVAFLKDSVEPQV